MTSTREVFIAILAGGPGSRLWPLSREARPKFLLELMPGKPATLVDTWQRCTAVTLPSHVLVVTGAAHAEAVLAALPELSAEQVIVEPSPRDSLAALVLAAEHVAAISPDAVLVTVPADNYANDTPAFAEAVLALIRLVDDTSIGTIGLEPTFPSTAHGYIHVVNDVVRSFTEKPSADLARRYVEGGEHLWNAGIFAGLGTTFVDAVELHHPEVLAAVRSGDTAWNDLAPLSIDHGIAEPEAAAGHMRTVRADFGWQDVGDVAALTDEDEDQDEHVRIASEHAVIRSTTGRVIAVVGLPGIVVIDTEDALLVTTPDHAPLVRKVVAELQARGRTDML